MRWEPGVLVRVVAGWSSGLVWYKRGESGEWRAWRWVGCKGEVVLEFVRVAPWRSKTLNQLRAVWYS